MNKKYCVGNVIVNLEFNEELNHIVECMEKYLHYNCEYGCDIISNYNISLKCGKPNNILMTDNDIHSFKEIIIYSDSKNKVKNVVKYFEYEDSEYFISEEFSLKKYKFNIEMIISEDNFNLERMPLRILRELLLRENENDSSMLFHGAFLKLLNYGVLLTGDKGAGKTTLLCKLLTHTNSKFLANDKLIIKKNLEVIYIPLSTRIALGTVNGNNKIKSFLNNNKLIRKENNSLIGVDTKYAFTSYEISKLFECDLISNSKVNMITIPRISENNQVKITRLDNCTAKKLLETSILTPYDIMWPNNWLVEKINTNEEM